MSTAMFGGDDTPFDPAALNAQIDEILGGSCQNSDEATYLQHALTHMDARGTDAAAQCKQRIKEYLDSKSTGLPDA